MRSFFILKGEAISKWNLIAIASKIKKDQKLLLSLSQNLEEQQLYKNKEIIPKIRNFKAKGSNRENFKICKILNHSINENYF